MYTFTVKGIIKEQKVYEFKVNIKRLMLGLTPDFKEYSLSRDDTSKNLYNLRIIWLQENSRKEFLKSEDYRYLISLFKILGIIESQTVGQSDILISET